MTLLPPPDPSALVHDRFVPTVASARVDVSGAPTPEETAAILAAVEHLWPRPVVAAPTDPAASAAAWRFSGRWWSRPTVTRRDRPWVR